MSNELSNYCGADPQPPLDDPGRFGAPGIGIDDHLACFTPKQSERTPGPYGCRVGGSPELNQATQITSSCSPSNLTASQGPASCDHLGTPTDLTYACCRVVTVPEITDTEEVTSSIPVSPTNNAPSQKHF